MIVFSLTNLIFSLVNEFFTLSISLDKSLLTSSTFEFKTDSIIASFGSLPFSNEDEYINEETIIDTIKKEILN